MQRAIAISLFCTVFLAAARSADIQDEVKAHHWRVLDSSKRARNYASWLTLPTTPAQFHKMQQKHRHHDFDVWAAKLRQLRPGMKEKEVLAILRPREQPVQMFWGDGFYDSIQLDDAYFANVYFSGWPHRMTGATTPLAISYEIKGAKAK
jgi:hypothetical protein